MELKYYKNHPHWKDFFWSDQADEIETHVKEKWINSIGTKIHIDIYEHSKTAPTVIYCHGLATNGRVMGPIAVKLYKLGYNVICPDLVGFGLSTQKNGSGTIPLFLDNLFDCINYAKTHYKGPRFLAGISLGGSLTYYAACKDADVNAIACYCLFDFSSPDTHNITNMGKTVIQLMIKLAKVGNHIFPNLYVPLKHFLKIEKISNNDDFIEAVRKNPLAVKEKTFRAGYHLLTTKPDIPFEKFDKIPILVVHGDKDRLIPENLSRMNYEKIPGKKKYVCLKNCEHVPTEPNHMMEYVKAMDEWFKKFT